jgi:hypothetical protein
LDGAKRGIKMPVVTSRQKISDAVIFGEACKKNALPLLLSHSPKNMLKAYDGKKQTPASAPVVVVNDLAKTHGTTVSVTIIHDTEQMGSTGIDKRGLEHAENISTASMEITVQQQHKSVKDALMIHQQAVGYDKKKVLRPALAKYHAKFIDEDFLYKICGARGTGLPQTNGRIWPLESDASFNNYAVEALQPPTFLRKGYCGSAKSIDATDGLTAITTADVFKPADVRKFKQDIELMSHPLEPVRMAPSEKSDGTTPMYMGFITPQQWTTFESNATDFEKLVANAIKRTRNFNHPLFEGDFFMKNNILFRKYEKPVRWSEGDTIKVSQNQNNPDPAEQTVPAGVSVERGFILGGQALAMAYASVLPSGTSGNFKYNQKLDDATLEAWVIAWIDWVAGCKKVRFPDANGRIEDYGVYAFDSAVPV